MSFSIYLCSEYVNHELSLLNLSLQDPKEKLILNLKREIKLLRTENAYFRQQVFSALNVLTHLEFELFVLML